MADLPTAPKKMFDAIQDWCGGHGITLVLDSTIGLGANFDYNNQAAPGKQNPHVVVRDETQGPMFLHEAFHAAYYLDEVKAQADPAKAKALEEGRTAMDRQINDLLRLENDLGPAEQGILENIFGSKSYYAGPISPTELFSYTNNLVDESRATSVTENDRVGHPMDNFNEFCASLSASAAYGDFKTFSKRLTDLQKAAEKNPELAKIYDQLHNVLAAALPLVTKYAEQLRMANGFGPEPPELMQMELNLAKMTKLLNELPLAQLQGEQASGNLAKR
ncbi:Uncharacterised protein [uncultured archaeon]|nr:Uncharacterised protein [uncultured archaeon]